MTMPTVHNTRITEVRALLAPVELRAQVPLSDGLQQAVRAWRAAVTRILDHADDRLLAVVGPCSIHDRDAALDYGARLARLAGDLAGEILVVMRMYFEKPRTTLGWKGLINDPGLDGSFRVNDGLRLARQTIVDILELGLPVGCEFVDPITPQYLADCVAWGSIGARTAQSQIHRQLASGLSMPVGIKNSTEGDVQAAVDAVAAAAASHVFPGIDDDGRPAIFTTTGNADCHVVLRGATEGPNYDSATVATTLDRLRAASLPARVVIDASHGNSQKDAARQLEVVDDVSRRLARGENGLVGLMIESFLERGRQDLVLGAASALTYGLSVTDACIGWDDTVATLRQLADAVATRRGAPAAVTQRTRS